MLRQALSTLTLGTLMLLWLTAAAAPQSGPEETPVAYVVVLRDTGADPALDAARVAQAHGAGVIHSYSHAIRGYSTLMTPAQAAAMGDDPRVAYVTQDFVITLDAQTVPTGVTRINGQPTDAHTNTGEGVNVAIIDTGIDVRHRDLRANVAGGKNCTTGDGYQDGHGHGTHVAGIVAAVDNRRGVVGVAPEARLWSVRVLDETGAGTLSSVICGIDFVTSMAPANGGPITVANMSLGGFGADDGDCGNSNLDPLHQAICQSVAAGVTYVVAAGNNATDAASVIPAAYDEVVTVSALSDSDGQPGGLGSPPDCRPTELDDGFASFSNFGADVDIAAPGVCILSTWLNGDYNTISGTSMAAPHVTGTAALYIATHPGATPADVKAALLGAGQPGPIAGDPDGIYEGVVDAGGF